MVDEIIVVQTSGRKEGWLTPEQALTPVLRQMAQGGQTINSVSLTLDQGNGHYKLDMALQSPLPSAPKPKGEKG